MGRIAPTAIALATCFAAPPVVAEDVPHGAQVFRQCRACHEVGEDARHRSGPLLNGIIGREAGTMEGFRYSEAMLASGLVWTPEALDAFLEDPRGVLPGSRMAFRGLSDPEDRADVIGFLQQFSEPAEPAAAAGLSPEAEAVLAVTPDIAYGEYLSSECTACHKPDADQGIPAIAGMAADAFVPAMLAYRSGEREHQVMNMMASRLGDEELSSLAAYFQGAD